MKIIQGTGWQGTFALAVEFIARDVLPEGPVETTLLFADKTCKHTGNLTAIENQELIFEDGKRFEISDLDEFELVD